MIYKPFQNIKLSRLGMGNMRLPSVDPKNPNADIDIPAAVELIQTAYRRGINYFDTAWVYNDGGSEKCVGEAMKDLPRDSYYLATKFYIDSTPDPAPVFEEQLRRLQTDHIDFYLLHCVMDANADKYLNSGAIDYFLEQKKQGRISYFGFSSHSSPATLRRFAEHHPWDFAQIQLNYFDWKFNTAKEEYEILAGHNIPVMVMEPVRGGRLAALTPECDAKLKAARPDWSISSWAMRFVKSLPGVQVILSGMSTMEQLEDNLKTFSDDGTLSESERTLLFEVADEFKDQIQVPCTACRYCCSGCPAKINIPEYLKLYNAFKVNGFQALGNASAIESEGKPADCLGCGACTGHCPQSIDTPSIMKELAKELQ